MVQYTENPIYSLPPGKNKFFNDFRLAYKLSYSKNLLVSCKTYFFSSILSDIKPYYFHLYRFKD